MVISTVNQVVYNGDGVTTAWPFTFRIIEATDIKLLLIDADGAETDITADYYVDTVNNTVYYPGYAPGAEPPAEDQPPKVQTGQKLVVYRELPITQEKDLGEKWPFYVIELGLDKLTMILQQIFDWWGRTLKISQGGSVEGFDTNVYPEAGKVIAVNEDGDGFEAKTAMLEENNAWEGKGLQIKSVAEPTDSTDAATKNYVDSYADGNFMKLETGGEAWEGRDLPIHNVTGSVQVNDAATKDYVDRILNGFVLAGDSRTVPFDTVAQLRVADIAAGQIAFTLGYHDINDGGAGVYTIRTATLSDVDDGGSIIVLDNGNVAELIVDGSVDVKQFGAYGDKTHDDTTAIQNACNFAFSIEDTGNANNQKGPIFKVTAGTGNYLVTDTITIKSSCDLSQMNILADGTTVSTVVAVGSDGGVSTYSKTLKLPNVFNYKNGSMLNVWDGTGIGMVFYNVQNSLLYIPQVTGFTNGVVLNPTEGNAYNNYFVEGITYCKVCWLNTRTGSGWANENIINGGRFVAYKDSNESWTGTRQIVFEQGSNIVFIKPSIESANVEYSIEMQRCQSVMILNARYEGAGAKRILFNATESFGVSRIQFIGGYQSESLNFTNIGTTPRYITVLANNNNALETINCTVDKGITVSPSFMDSNYYAKLTRALRLKYNETNTYDDIFLGRPSNVGLYFPKEASGDEGGNDYDGGLAIRPFTTNFHMLVNKNLFSSGEKDLGSATYRWGTLYATNGTIDTSDEREKQDIEPIEDAVFRAWSKVNFVQFRFKDAVAKKGEGARIHCGLIAQQVKEAFESEGLDAFRYGLLCYDEWDDEYEDVTNEDGTVSHELVTEAGNRYGIRYEEALALECAYQRWLGNKLEAKVEALEQILRV